MAILVTGGAGYIGSIIVEELIKEGEKVIVVDNLKEGHRKAVSPEASFIEGDLAEKQFLRQIFEKNQIDSVIHMAAEALVEQSMIDPKRFFRNNVINGINLLEAMLEFSVKKLIFSSTAAVYGNPQEIPIDENHPQNPINPYGESKFMFERILEWYHGAYDLNFISLRYFNAAGASAKYGEDHSPETHLIPNILKVALGQKDYLTIYGNDYETPDGSCIRDYIHVVDLARAHILALKALSGSDAQHAVYNLGNERGYSVLQILEAAKKVTRKEIPYKLSSRRKGDPAILVASSQRIKARLGWKAFYTDIEAIIESAWRWHRENPYGYGD